jgi:hypothetical protein
VGARPRALRRVARDRNVTPTSTPSAMRLTTLPLVLLTLAATPALAQGRAAATRPSPGGTVPIAVALTVNDTAYTSSGRGVCRRRTGTNPGWNVSYQVAPRGNQRAVGVVLSVTSGARGSNRYTLTLAARGARRVSSFGARPVGSGTVDVAARGNGWLFTLDLRDAKGAVIKGTVTCEGESR